MAKAKQRKIRVRGERRDPPDTRKLARALIAYVQAELEAEALREHQNRKDTKAQVEPHDGKGLENAS